MTKEAEVLFKLIRIALGNEEDFSLPNAVNWESVFELANRQGVDAIAWMDILSERSEEFGINEYVKYKWIGHQAIVEKENYVRFQALKNLGKLWSAEGITPLVLKGLSYAVLYPNPQHRKSCDLDSFLFDRWEVGNTIVERQGIEVGRNYYKDSSFTFQGLYVENHRYCSPIRGGKQKKKYELFLRKLLENYPLKKISGTDFFTPPPLFNLMFFLSHAQNHFLCEGGIQLRHVCDWGVLMKEYAEDSSLWDGVIQYAECFGLQKFLYPITQVAQKVCGVKAPFECPVNDSVDSALLEEIIHPTCEQVEFSKGWKTRILLIKSMIQTRWKFKMFSEQRMIVKLFSLCLAFFFERNPVLKK